MSQPNTAPETPASPAPPAPRPQRIDWYWFAGFIIGMLAGQSIGRRLGADYEPVGNATGEALGQWIGFGVGMMVGSVLGALAGRLIRREPVTAKWAAGIVGLFVLMYGLLTVCAIGGEILAGHLGGILGVIFPVVPFFLIGVIYQIIQKRR